MSKKILLISTILISISAGAGLYLYFNFRDLRFEASADDPSDAEAEELSYGSIVPEGKSAPGEIRTYAQNTGGGIFPSKDKIYRFEFDGNDGDNIRYEIDTRDSETKEGSLKIKGALNGQIFLPLENNGVLWRKDEDKIYYPNEAKNFVSTTLYNHQLENEGKNKFVVFYYQDIFNLEKGRKIERKRSLTLKITGKSLKIKTRSIDQNNLVEADYNYAGFSLGEPSGAETLKKISIPYMTNVPVGLINNKFYFSAYLNPTQSRATKISPSKEQKKYNPLESLYEIDASNKVSSFKEVAFLTLSSNIIETFPKPTNPNSDFREDLSKRVVWSTWREGDFLKGKDGLGLAVPIKIDNLLFNDKKLNNDKVFLELLHKFGLEDLLVLEHSWRNSPVNETVPEHLPIPENIGGETEYKNLTSTAKKLGYLFAEHELWPYIYAEYLNPKSPQYKEEYTSFVARDKNNEPNQLNAFAGGGIQYTVLPHKLIELAQMQIPTLKAYGTQGAFLDTAPAYNPRRLNQIDFSSINQNSKNLSQAIIEYKKFFNYLKSVYHGPLLGEGGEKLERFDSYYAGFIDGVERESDYAIDGYIIPDYEQYIIKPKMANFGMGWHNRWLCSQKDNCEVDFNSFDYDRYRAQTISFGHSTMLPNYHNLNPTNENLQKLLKQIIKEYYLTKTLQYQYLSSNVEAIKYYNQSGEIGDISALFKKKPNYDLSSSLLKITYQNGLTMFINNDQKKNWNIKVENEEYVLPPNGWLGINKKIKGWNNQGFFLAYSALKNEKKVDFVSSQEYIFLDGRGENTSIQNVESSGMMIKKQNGLEIICSNQPVCSINQ